MDKNTQTDIEPLLLNTKEVAQILGISRTKVFGMIATGQFAPTPIRFGRRVLYNRKTVEKWVELGCPKRGNFEILLKASK